MTLESDRTLARSGLAVSPFALGTMTFGTARWGSGEQASRAVFNAYVDAGGNFVDTADVYAGGRSEELLGRFIAERRLRDSIVLFARQSRHRRRTRASGCRVRHGHHALEPTCLWVAHGQVRPNPGRGCRAESRRIA
jgi:aryl-alcohol dehydrogenase-like predicted oxidoreductase